MNYFVSVEDVVNEFELFQLTDNSNLKDRKLTSPDINRLALPLTGFFDYFAPDRLNVIGQVEYSYMEGMDWGRRAEVLERLMNFNPPGIVLARSLMPGPDMLHYAKLYGVPVFSASYLTSDFMAEVIRWLRVKLAPRITIHGVLLDVFGEGVLIMGESGIGKSELALELIKRGHRFVADDAVEIKKVSKDTVIGSCPELIRYFIELRGIGIIDVRQMFGVQSIKATQSIDIVIRLDLYDKSKEYDRLGAEEQYIEFLGNRIVCHTIPIRPGRNLAIICESAAINHRQKKIGYNAALQLIDKTEGKQVIA